VRHLVLDAHLEGLVAPGGAAGAGAGAGAQESEGEGGAAREGEERREHESGG
jgi:hypothetical protein